MYHLEVSLIFSVALCWLILRLGRRQSKFTKGGNNVDITSYEHWKGVVLSIVDGLIAFYKIRYEGMAVFGKFLGNGLKISLGPKMLYLTADVDLIQKVLKSPAPGHLQKPKYFYEMLISKFVGDGLFASSVDIWQHHRKASLFGFSYKSLGIHLKCINQTAKDLVEKITSLADRNGNGWIDNKQMAPILDSSTFQLILRIVVGSECARATLSSDEIRAFQEVYRKWKNINVARVMNPLLHVPFIWWLHPKRRQLDAVANAIHKFTVKVISGYRKYRSSKDMNKRSMTVQTDTDNFIGVKSFGCVVEQLIAGGLTEKEIIDEVATLLIAGPETIRVALNFLIFQLAVHPDCQRKCQSEIDQLLSHSKFGGGELDETDCAMDDLSNLKYLERCILESLRLTATLPLYARQLGVPLQISQECTIDAGSIIFIIAWAVHRNSAHYPNPDVFNPDRFLAENVRKRHPYSFIPFSMGARNCIGWKFALMQLKVFMASILRHFNLSTTDELHQVKIFFELNSQPERPYNVTFEKRVR